MEQAIQLSGYLILTVLGFVLPIMAILLSIFREGITKLADQYKNERSQSEDNIREQLGKKSQAKDIDVSAIEQSIKELKSIKKAAETKLSYLNPLRQIVQLFISLIFAFLGVVATLLLVDTSIYYSFFLLISAAGFVYAIFILWKLTGIIVEVRKIIDTDRKDADTRTTELLSALVVEIKKTGQYYLRKVYVTLDTEDISDDSFTISLQANSKTELKVGIRNHESRMAKNIEIGFIFPTNFIIEKTDYYSIYRDEEQQVVRQEVNLIHGNTNLKLRPIIVTPLEQGEHEIRTFVKAENIESSYKNITFEVT